MPENNSMPYDNTEEKKDGMENPSSLSLHIHETSPVLAFKEAFHTILQFKLQTENYCIWMHICMCACMCRNKIWNSVKTGI